MGRGKGKYYNIEGKGKNITSKLRDDVTHFFNDYHDEKKKKNKKSGRPISMTCNVRNELLGCLLESRLYDDRIEIEQSRNNRLIKEKTNNIYNEILYLIELSIGRNKLHTLSHISIQQVAKNLRNYDIDELNQFFSIYIFSLPVKSLLMYWGCRYNTINDDNIRIISSLTNHDAYKLSFLTFGDTITVKGIQNFFSIVIDNVAVLTEQEEWLILCEGHLSIYEYLPVRYFSLISSPIDVKTFATISQYLINVITIKLHDVFNSQTIIKKKVEYGSFIDDKPKDLVEHEVNEVLLTLTKFTKVEKLEISYCQWLTEPLLLTFYNLLTIGTYKLHTMEIEGCDISYEKIESIVRLYNDVGIKLNIKK